MMASGVTRTAVRARARWRSHGASPVHRDGTAYRPGATRVSSPRASARSSTRALTPLARTSGRTKGCGRWSYGIRHGGAGGVRRATGPADLWTNDRPDHDLWT